MTDIQVDALYSLAIFFSTYNPCQVLTHLRSTTILYDSVEGLGASGYAILYGSTGTLEVRNRATLCSNAEARETFIRNLPRKNYAMFYRKRWSWIGAAIDIKSSNFWH